MISFNGYELHNVTYRRERAITSDILTYVRCKLLDFIKSLKYVVSSYRLTEKVREPDFFSDLDCECDYNTAFSKALNEVCVHFRFYLDFSQSFINEIVNDISDVDNFDDFEFVDNDIKEFSDCVITDLVSTNRDDSLRRLFYYMYSNSQCFRRFVRDNGGIHVNSFANILKRANFYYSTKRDAERRLYFNTFRGALYGHNVV